MESTRVLEIYEIILDSLMPSFPHIGKMINASYRQGVYIIYSQENSVLHVGKTDRGKGGLNQRLSNHLYNQSSFSKQYATPKGIDLRLMTKFKYIEVENPRLRTFVEALAVGKLCPAHIGTGAKKHI